jgi:tight adherence protein B
VKAITAEAKWSGMFLSGFPIAGLAMMNIINPGYYDEVKESVYWVPACLLVAGFLIANIIVMRALVNIKV